MDLKHKIIGFLVGLLFMFFIRYFLKKNSLHPTASVCWIAVTMFLLSIPFFSPAYRYVSTSVIGFEDSRHIIYLAIIGFLLAYSFYLTIKISTLSNYVKILIKDVAILENSIETKNNEN